jgi:formylglycine-generating enzyme required for sulfatase activity
MITNDEANIRTGPGTEFDRVATLDSGQELTVVARVAGRDWFRVALSDGVEGYVWAPLLDLPKATVAVATPPPPTPQPEQPQPEAAKPTGTARDEFQDCGDCPEMVVVPAGRFEMGSAGPDLAHLIDEEGAKFEWISDETPRHEVIIAKPFAVGKYEVTRAEFGAFIVATGHQVENWCFVYERNKWQRGTDRNWRKPGFIQGEQEPVVCASWRDAKAYVAWLSKTTGETYRLLSEAEWEYAARAGTRTRRYWGNDMANKEGCAYANVSDMTRASRHRLRRAADNVFSCEDGTVLTADTGAYKPNAFGLYDMLGNVWEWVEDCYHDSYSGAGNTARAWTERGCERRVLRGASWDYDPRAVRAANRGFAEVGDRSLNIGFRVARDMP